MTLNLGSTAINKTYLGSAEINKAYLGSNLIYNKTAPASGWSVIGSIFTGEGISAASPICKINSSTIALLNDNENELQAFSWNGSALSATGTNLTGFTSVVPDANLVYLTDGKILLSENGNAHQAYDWAAGVFTTNGSSISLNIDTSVAGSSSTRFFALERFGGLKCYDQSGGGTWSQTGSALSLSVSFKNHAITVLDNTADAEVIAVYNESGTTLKVYSFNGSTFTEEASLSFDAGTQPQLATLTTSTFSLTDTTTLDLYHFTYSGGTITQTSGTSDLVTDLSLSGAQPRLGNFDTGEILVSMRTPGNMAILSYS